MQDLFQNNSVSACAALARLNQGGYIVPCSGRAPMLERIWKAYIQAYYPKVCPIMVL